MVLSLTHLIECYLPTYTSTLCNSSEELWLESFSSSPSEWIHLADRTVRPPSSFSLVSGAAAGWNQLSLRWFSHYEQQEAFH